MRDRQLHTLRAALLALLAAVAAVLVAAAPSWAALPDGRVDELVSTAGSVGEPYHPASALDEQEDELFGSEHPYQASEDGESITYAGEAPATGGTGEIGDAEGDQWLARRTSHGWETTGITYGAVNPEEAVPYAPYEAFSPDLTAGFVMGNPRDPYTAEVPMGCRSLYLRETETGDLRALVTPSEAPVKTSRCGKPLFVGATEDASQVIFESEAPLTPNAEEATELPPLQERHANPSQGQQYGEACMFGCNLYEAGAGPLRLVNVLPNGETVPNATFGGYPGLPVGGREEEKSPLNDYSNAMSAEGSTIFWTDTQEGPDLDHIYAWESGHSVQVSGAGVAKYWTAAPDGRFAYYTEAGRLWRFDTETNTATPLTPEGSGVEGVIGTNQTGEDGNYLYFVADAALAPGSSARICTELPVQHQIAEEEFNKGLITAEEEQAVSERVLEEQHQERSGGTPAETGCNLYLLHEGRTALIAVLSPADDRLRGSATGDQASGDWQPGLGERTAEVTPDGVHLVFESRYPLTGYDSVGPREFTIPEVFVYSAKEASLVCASCSPTRTPPTVADNDIEGLSRLPVSIEDSTYMHRWISSDGDRVFFDSEQPLSPADRNKTQDVYEWEREDTPGCPTATSAYGGCISLLSNGTTETYSFLVDADATGDNVFFEHVGPLGALEAPFDRNELYDSRVDGGFSASTPVCTGNTCQGIPPAPPSFEPPATATSSAGANYPAPPSAQPQVTPAKRLTNAQRLAKAVKACRKLRVKHRRASCERRARRRYAPARKAANSAIKPDNRG